MKVWEQNQIKTLEKARMMGFFLFSVGLKKYF